MIDSFSKGQNLARIDERNKTKDLITTGWYEIKGCLTNYEKGSFLSLTKSVVIASNNPKNNYHAKSSNFSSITASSSLL